MRHWSCRWVVGWGFWLLLTSCNTTPTPGGALRLGTTTLDVTYTDGGVVEPDAGSDGESSVDTKPDVPDTCLPQCEGMECGDDGCGTSCGACEAPEVCSPEGACVCVPECAARDCGPDGCGGSCGECPGLGVCSQDGQCLCEASCAGKSCGDDGCGGTCGVCDEQSPLCAAGVCLAVCTPDCEGKGCGEDGCGGTCDEASRHLRDVVTT